MTNEAIKVIEIPERVGLSLEAAQAISDLIEAAEALYDCYTLEDQSKDFWKTDPVLSPRLASLFFKVEALREVPS